MCCREVYCVRRCVCLCRCLSGWVLPSVCISVRVSVSLVKADGWTWVETESLQGIEVPNNPSRTHPPPLRNAKCEFSPGQEARKGLGS